MHLYTGDYSTALGWNAQATGNYSTALGYSAHAAGNASTALGYYAQATGYGSTALGYNAQATGDASTALGWNAHAAGNGSTALGYYALVGKWTYDSGNDEWDWDTSVDTSFSIALGAESVAPEANVISVGHRKGDGDYYNDEEYSSDLFRRIINVADGTGDHDAATVGQMNTAISTAISSISLNDNDYAVLKKDNNYFRNSDGNIAINVAMKDNTIYMHNPDGSFDNDNSPYFSYNGFRLRDQNRVVTGLTSSGSGINTSNTRKLARASDVAEALTNYLPLTGGTMSGNILVKGSSKEVIIDKGGWILMSPAGYNETNNWKSYSVYSYEGIMLNSTPTETVSWDQQQTYLRPTGFKLNNTRTATGITSNNTDTSNSSYLTTVDWVNTQLSSYVPTSRTINGKALTGNITLTAADVGALPSTTALFSGNYNDLTNKPTIPTNTNQLTNGAGFITSSVSNLTNYYTKNESDESSKRSNLTTQNGDTLNKESNTFSAMAENVPATKLRYNNKPTITGTNSTEFSLRGILDRKRFKMFADLLQQATNDNALTITTNVTTIAA